MKEKTKKIIIGSAIGVVTVGCGIFIYNDYCIRAMNVALNAENMALKAEKVALKAENLDLKKLCSIKDSFFIAQISDGLRHGSSIAAKQMAYRRWPGVA
jgi:hypothetical protein